MATKKPAPEPARRSLFKIGEDIEGLHEYLYETFGDVTDEDLNDKVDQWLSDLSIEETEKIEQYCYVIRNNETLGNAAESEQKRVKALADRRKALVKLLKDRLKYYFEHVRSPSIKSYETPMFKLLVKGNGGTRALVLDPRTNDQTHLEEHVPAIYIKQIYVLDVEAVRQDLERVETSRARLVQMRGDNALTGHPINGDQEKELEKTIADLEARLSGVGYLEPRGTHLEIK